MAGTFLDDRRLLKGPWQAFERDIARLFVGAGFDDVRIVGGSGDKGADIIGVKNREIWVVQCKHTTTGPPTKSAVQEVVDAGRYYKADRMVVLRLAWPVQACRPKSIGSRAWESK